MTQNGLFINLKKRINYKNKTIIWRSKLKKRRKNIVAVGGIISTVLGVVGAVPSFLQANYGVATGSAILIVAGLVMLALAFGD